MVWTIPLVDVAGVLAVTFTSGTPALHAPPSLPPVQRPGPSGESPPADAPPADAPPTDPFDTAPAEVVPPELPFVDPLDQPMPPATAPGDSPSAAAPTTSEPIEIPAPAGTRPAGRERLLRPTDRRGFFTMSAGGATAGPSYYNPYGGSSMDFQMEAVIGTHNRRFPNFGGGFVVQYRHGFATELSFAGRLQWDRPLSKSFAIYSSADFTFGINEQIALGGYFYAGIPSALLGVGWGVKMIMAERLMLFFRPVGPNLVAPSFGNQVLARFRWDMGAGIGVVW